MPQELSKQFLEKIPHITNISPYSVHRTMFSKDISPALYLHFHPEFEFLYLAEGSLEITIHNTSYNLQVGDAIFIPPNLLHTANALSEQGVFYAVVFSQEVLNSFDNQFTTPFTNEPGMNYVLQLTNTSDWQLNILWYLERIFFHADEFSPADIFVKSHLMIAWQYLYKYHIVTHTPHTKENSHLKGVLQLIHTHYQDDITLEDLTRVAHMSKEHLCRTFKKYTGYTPFAYLKYYRILQSCRFLSETDKKISEICTLCGFNNISYFNREFLQTMNTTPSKYRKELFSKAP